MRIDRRVSPNQTALWTIAELRGYTDSRAISGPLRSVNHGQQRVTRSGLRRRSGPVASPPCRSSKLVMRVRFPSSALNDSVQFNGVPLRRYRLAEASRASATVRALASVPRGIIR